MIKLSSEITCGVSDVADVNARFELNRLLDYYGPLLTEHRREVVRLYCEEDLSLAEIAQQLGITRQGVSDALNKARMQLNEMEEKLGFAKRESRWLLCAEACIGLLRAGQSRQDIEALLQAMIDER